MNNSNIQYIVLYEILPASDSHITRQLYYTITSLMLLADYIRHTNHTYEYTLNLGICGYPTI